MKKISIFLTTLLAVILMFSTNVFATTNVLKVVEKSSETKKLENDQGYISKTIVDSDEENGEVTIELKLENTSEEKVQTTTTTSNGSAEIVLVIDDSGSMSDEISAGITRREAVYNASKELVNKVFDTYNNVKIGVVKFGGGDDTIEDAQKMCDLTNNKETVLSAITAESNVTGATNLEAGILVAKGMYSTDNTNKIMIILTDGIPNSAIPDNDKSVTEITKETLINTSNSGINVVTMLTETDYPDYAEEIFGTPTNPTVGKYYYIADSSITTIISDSIYNDVIEKIHIPNENITETKIIDYFPKDIMDNFEFSYVGNPSMGTISDKIDDTTKTITWNIGTVKDLEVASVKYKLKLKDMNNTNLFDKVIATNEKVVLTYKDAQAADYTVTLDSSPKIKLTEQKEDDDSVATTKIPKTGIKSAIVVVIGVAAIGGAIFYTKYNKFKNI